MARGPGRNGGAIHDDGALHQRDGVRALRVVLCNGKGGRHLS